MTHTSTHAWSLPILPQIFTRRPTNLFIYFEYIKVQKMVKRAMLYGRVGVPSRTVLGLLG
jgi:hypothetical protein